jgi:hypothetical protein
MSGCSPSVTKYGLPGVPLKMANRAASVRFLQRHNHDCWPLTMVVSYQYALPALHCYSSLDMSS